MNRYYAMMVNLTNRPCLVIGGGRVAERKILSLLKANAKVKLISPVITPLLETLVQENRISWEKRGYKRQDVKGYSIIVVATDQKELNQQIYQEIDHQYQWVNIVDDPELSTFIVPAMIDRGHLQIAVSTSGASPGLAKKIRQELEKQYGVEYEEYTTFLAEMREWILQQGLTNEERKNLFEYLLEPDFLRRIEKGESKDLLILKIKETIKENINKERELLS
ncbi:bifunctional precorrin-2 dehydrogenase/sirohydrochlorin ferrochelatase [Tepidibacillus infernus]|uniref:precorrin-2 dehydrogenase/sirohydrochlorin ferrochelatase family protein n=1 Tax=Tepidibacillus infernus TaxID=1806172 RepID=UPI003B715C3A